MVINREVSTDQGTTIFDGLPLVKRVKELYPQVVFELLYDSTFLSTTFEVSLTSFDKQVYLTRAVVPDEETAKYPRDELESYTAEIYERLCQELVESVGEEVTGKYPFIRLWADRRVSQSGVPKLFMRPNQNIPGWVFNQFRGQRDYPDQRKGQLIRAGDWNGTVKDFDWDETVKDFKGVKQPVLKWPTPAGGGVRRLVLNEDDKQLMKEVEESKMGETKRKVKVVKKPIDPSTIKKPTCKVHSKAMEFDSIRQVWACDEEGCGLIARPKGDEDRSVRIGKGNVQCRLISQNGEQTVILISDDNVALDITRFVDMEKLLDIFDAISIADSASDNGREQFSISDPKELPLKMGLTVMGSTDLAISKET